MDKTVYLFKYWCFLWQLLIHVEQAERHQRPFNHPPAEVSAARKRWWLWGGAHESQVLDSCSMFNYSTATMQAKGERESITVHGACSGTVWELDLVIPFQWHFVNTDPLLLIRHLRPTTSTNNSVIAMTVMVPIHSYPHQRRRRKQRKKVPGLWISPSCDAHSPTETHLCVIMLCGTAV